MGIENGRLINPAELNELSKELLSTWFANSRMEIYHHKNPEKILQQIAALPGTISLEIACRPAESMARALVFADQVRMLDKKPVVHFGARYVGKSEYLQLYIEGLKEYRNIFFIGGDIKEEDTGPIKSTNDLLEKLRIQEFQFNTLGFPIYPDGHDFLSDDELKDALKKKFFFVKRLQENNPNVRAYLTSQWCFDPEIFLTYVRKIRNEGIKWPVYYGIPGYVSVDSLLRVLKDIGLKQSLSFAKKYPNYLFQFIRGYKPDEIIKQLAQLAKKEDNIAGFVFGTFNGLAKNEEWKDNFKKMNL